VDRIETEYRVALERIATLSNRTPVPAALGEFGADAPVVDLTSRTLP